eukprot:scaffold7518_cov350-Prasinococcus_capsulatus_cf.AAC.3
MVPIGNGGPSDVDADSAPHARPGEPLGPPFDLLAGLGLTPSRGAAHQPATARPRRAFRDTSDGAPEHPSR